jgi:hypothetical protein
LSFVASVASVRQRTCSEQISVERVVLAVDERQPLPVAGYHANVLVGN